MPFPTTPVVPRRTDGLKMLENELEKKTVHPRPVEPLLKEICLSPTRRALPAENHGPTMTRRPGSCGQKRTKTPEQGPEKDGGSHSKEVVNCYGNKEGGGGTVKRKGGLSGSGSLQYRQYGASWLGLLPVLRLLLVVCSLAKMEAYDKLPNGDGGYSATGTAGTLRRKVSNWIDGGTSRSTVVAQYGAIEDWDVSEVTNMAYVFDGEYNASTFGSFNADLSNWDMGAVTNMQGSKCYLYLNMAK
jgi:hypothetical protein